MRHFTDVTGDVLTQCRLLICNRDPKWNRAVVAFLEREGHPDRSNAGSGTEL